MHATTCPSCSAQMRVPYSGTWTCLTCNDETEVRFDDSALPMNHAFHAAVVVFTAGLWLPFYLILVANHGRTPHLPVPKAWHLNGLLTPERPVRDDSLTHERNMSDV